MYKRSALWTLFFLALVSAFLAWQLPSLKFNYVFEDFFPVDDPELDYYQAFKERFGEDNDYLLIAIESNNGVFNENYLNRISVITDSLAQLDGTTAISSITNTAQPVIGPIGIFQVPLVHFDEPEKLSTDSIRLYRQPFLRSSLLAEDGTASLLFLKHYHFTDRQTADDYLSTVREILTSGANGRTTHMAGKIYAQQKCSRNC